MHLNCFSYNFALLLFIMFILQQWSVSQMFVQQIHQAESDIISRSFIKLKHLHLTTQFCLHGPSNVAVGQLIYSI